MKALIAMKLRPKFTANWVITSAICAVLLAIAARAFADLLDLIGQGSGEHEHSRAARALDTPLSGKYQFPIATDATPLNPVAGRRPLRGRHGRLLQGP
jgi:hypothetical protein